ncbi:class I SAM-dependent methyltransferase [Streptomyces sp. NPDC003710]
MSGLDSQVPYWDAAAATKTFTHPPHLPWLNEIGRQAAILDYGCDYGPLRQHRLIAEPNRLLKPGGLLYVSDLLLQDDEHNRTRYNRHADHYGSYGVFETGDGAVCRHHSREWLSTHERA